jgi:hypothetical protein
MTGQKWTKEEVTREHSVKGCANSEAPACPCGTTPLVLDAFSCNFIFGCFTKILFYENQYSLKSDKT